MEKMLYGGNFVKPAIERLDFEGLMPAVVVGHDPDRDNHRIQVWIPKLMSNITMSPAKTHTESISDSCIANRNSISVSKNITVANYYWVYPMEWAIERDNKDAIEHNTRRDTVSRSSGIAPHIHPAKTVARKEDPDPKPILKDKEFFSDWDIDEEIKKITVEGHFTGTPEDIEIPPHHIYHKTVIGEAFYFPKIGHPPELFERVLVFFLDGDPKKGYWLPFSPAIQ